MQIIYSSKLYRASKRKDKIHAALADPSNSGLVQQLVSYLDPEYRDINHRADVEQDFDPDFSVDFDTFDEAVKDPSGPSRGHSSGGGGSHFSGPSMSFSPSGGGDDDSLTDDFKDAEETLGDDAGPDTEVEQDLSGDMSDAEEVQEAVDINNPVVNHQDEVSNKIDVIRRIVDPEDDIVSHMKVKKDELWIYCKDSINLNNIMEDVINKVGSSEYDYLSFNRLARSDNAIVFEIEEN